MQRSDWKTSKPHLLLVLSTMLLLTVAREPRLLYQPRFWAEEGSVFFQQALHYNWYDVILMPFRCNYFMFPRICTLIAAHFLPLSYAPLLTTLAALLVQMVPFILILFFPQRLFSTIGQMYLACLFILFLVPAPDIWLTSTNSHWHATVCGALILIINLDHASRHQKIALYSLTVFVGLSGIPPNFLLPIYWMKHLIVRTRASLCLTLTATATCFVQLLAFGYGVINAQAEGRLESFTLKLWLYRLLDQPIKAMFLNWAGLPFPDLEKYPDIAIYAGLLLLLFVLAALIVFLLRPLEQLDIFILLGCAVILFPLMLTFSLKMEGGARYMYPPGVLLLLAFLARMVRDYNRGATVRNVTLAIVLLMACVNSGVLYLKNRHLANPAGTLSTYEEDWPHWREEIEHWRLDSAYRPRIHPQWPGRGYRITVPHEKSR